MAVDSSRPFPLVHNKSLNLAALLKKKDGDEEEDLDFALVRVPNVLPRLVEITTGEDRAVILLEEVIERNIQSLFLNYNIITAHPFRIMRNADFTIDEEDAEDLLKEIQKQLKKRQWGEAIRLEIEENADKRVLKRLKKELDIHSSDIYEISGPLDLTFLMKMYGLDGFDGLKAPKYTPQTNPAFLNDDDIFTNIRKGDILLSHPYESFDPVVDFVKTAAKDPKVLAIKQTLYRVSGNSPIIAALAEAADNGKQVSVLVELKARFDEENNINWAKMLEKAGCHVIYGLVGLKTHSKITLTCNPQIGEDATAVFNMLSGYSEPLKWNQLVVAPIWLRKRFMRMIQRETNYAREGRPARIIAKVNSLCDKEIIAALYEASCAGVKIDLIIRGICCLRAGVPNLSENIAVRSIVGNFLEHSRIFYFENDGYPEIYMGSADWMPRNLDRRVEIMFPILDEKLKEKAMHILNVQLSDNLKAHVLGPDGIYNKIDRRGKAAIGAQDTFCKEAVEAVKAASEEVDPVNLRVFIPAESVEH